MEPSHYSIQTPKTPRKQCTRDDNLRIHTLYFDAGFTEAQIALNLTPRQVQYALEHGLTPQKAFVEGKSFEYAAT